MRERSGCQDHHAAFAAGPWNRIAGFLGRDWAQALLRWQPLASRRADAGVVWMAILWVGNSDGNAETAGSSDTGTVRAYGWSGEDGDERFTLGCVVGCCT